MSNNVSINLNQVIEYLEKKDVFLRSAIEELIEVNDAKSAVSCEYDRLKIANALESLRSFQNEYYEF